MAGQVVILEEHLAASLPDILVTGRARGTLHLEVDGIPTSILSYRYPLLAQTERHENISVPIASGLDLACMKVSAIAGRGAASYARKFPIEDVGHAVRSLAYFADADAAPLPLDLSPTLWITIKESFAKRVRTL